MWEFWHYDRVLRNGGGIDSLDLFLRTCEPVILTASPISRSSRGARHLLAAIYNAFPERPPAPFHCQAQTAIGLPSERRNPGAQWLATSQCHRHLRIDANVRQLLNPQIQHNTLFSLTSNRTHTHKTQTRPSTPRRQWNSGIFLPRPFHSRILCKWVPSTKETKKSSRKKLTPILPGTPPKEAGW